MTKDQTQRLAHALTFILSGMGLRGLTQQAGVDLSFWIMGGLAIAALGTSIVYRIKKASPSIDENQTVCGPPG